MQLSTEANSATAATSAISCVLKITMCLIQTVFEKLLKHNLSIFVSELYIDAHTTAATDVSKSVVKTYSSYVVYTVSFL